MTAEHVALFAGWLRLPPEADSGTVTALSASDSHRPPATIRRKLAAVSSLHDFHQRRKVDVSASLTAAGSTWLSRHRWNPFMSHLSPRQVRGLAIEVTVPKRTPKNSAPEQVSAVLAACRQPRDRLFFTVLADAGLRAGEALGLRHEDLDCRGRLVFVRPRRNVNGTRVKSQTERAVPVPAALIRLYSDYLHEQCGDLDSDYVFVNLTGPADRPWRCSSVHDLVVRPRRRSSVPFTPHAFRHAYATELLRRGVAVEVVHTLLGHSSVVTTSQTYAHIKVEDARAALFNPLLNEMRTTTATSLLDRTADQWLAGMGRLSKRYCSFPGLVRFIVRCLEDMRDGGGLDAEYPRVVWHLRRLNLAREHGNVTGSISFDDIPQPWLRDVAKRYMRMRLTAGLNETSVQRHHRCVAMLAGFIYEQAPGSRSAAVLTRDMLEPDRRSSPRLGAGATGVDRGPPGGHPSAARPERTFPVRVRDEPVRGSDDAGPYRQPALPADPPDHHGYRSAPRRCPPSAFRFPGPRSPECAPRAPSPRPRAEPPIERNHS